MSIELLCAIGLNTILQYRRIQDLCYHV